MSHAPLQQLPAGPANMTEARPDLTQVFDPVELWPEAEACPDWPLRRSTVALSMADHFSEQDARNRLKMLAYHLNKEWRTFQPNKAERDKLVQEYFVRDGDGFPGLGLVLTPRNRSDHTAEMIVEAVHLQGYLRKLDERSRQASARADAEKNARHNLAMSQNLSAIRAAQTELDGLKEAEERHRQRLQDEAASIRAGDLRQTIESCRWNARQAAHALNIEIPEEAK